LATATDVFEDTAWYRYVPFEMALTAPGAEALSIHAGFCSTSFLRVLGAQTALGRTFAADEPPNSALISDHLWRTHFAADPGVSGRAIRLNDEVFTVIGCAGRVQLSRLGECGYRQGGSPATS
jgi:hypothetical protein